MNNLKLHQAGEIRESRAEVSLLSLSLSLAHTLYLSLSLTHPHNPSLRLTPSDSQSLLFCALFSSPLFRFPFLSADI